MLDFPITNWQADSLAKTGAALPYAHVSNPLVPVIVEIRHIRYNNWRRNLSHNSLFCQIPSVSTEELVLPRQAVNFPISLPRSQPSFVLLHEQDKTKEFLWTSSEWSNSPPASEPLRRASFGTTSFLTSGPDLEARPDCWVSAEFLHASPSLGKGRVAPSPLRKEPLILDLVFTSMCREVTRW